MLGGDHLDVEGLLVELVAVAAVEPEGLAVEVGPHRGLALLDELARRLGGDVVALAVADPEGRGALVVAVAHVVLLARDVRDLATWGAGLARAVRLEEALAVGARDPHVVLVLVLVLILVLHRTKVGEGLELVLEDHLVLAGRVLVLVPEAVVL